MLTLDVWDICKTALFSNFPGKKSKCWSIVPKLTKKPRKNLQSECYGIDFYTGGDPLMA